MLHKGLKANRTQGIAIKELEKSETPSQPSYELTFRTLRAFLLAPFQKDGKVIRKGMKDEHAMASVTKRENKKSKPEKELIQGRQRGVSQQSDEWWTQNQRSHLVLTQELQSNRWMLLPWANAWVTTGHCRGQKKLKWCKKPIRKRHWRKSSQGLLKAITQIQAWAEEAPQPRPSLPGRAGPNHFAFPSCSQQPRLLSHQNPQNAGLDRPLWPFQYFPMESCEAEPHLILVQWDHALKIVISKSLSPAQEWAENLKCHSEAMYNSCKFCHLSSLGLS